MKEGTDDIPLILIDGLKAPVVADGARGNWRYDERMHTWQGAATPIKDIFSHPWDAVSYGVDFVLTRYKSTDAEFSRQMMSNGEIMRQAREQQPAWMRETPDKSGGTGRYTEQDPWALRRGQVIADVLKGGEQRNRARIRGGGFDGAIRDGAKSIMRRGGIH